MPAPVAAEKPAETAPAPVKPAPGLAAGIAAVPAPAPKVLSTQESQKVERAAAQGESAPEQGSAVSSTEEQGGPKISPTKEMQELRKFEESAFPRGPAALPPPAILDPEEGATPHEHGVRSSAESPPESLRSASHLGHDAQDSVPPPQSWMAKLVLPDLPIRWDPKVIRYLEFYRSSPYGRAIMKSWLTRMGRYQELISAILHQHKVPKDLIYLAMVESGFNPGVTSRVGAAGIWQFMPKSGRGYGLHRDYWVDERRNPERSTEAAVRFLKDLYERFGTWELALAAYNAGYGAVAQSIRKYNTNDYWRLCSYEAGLPWETSLYVPKILAVAIVGNNRAVFGYEQVQPRDSRSFDLVAVSTSLTTSQAGRAAGVEAEVIEELNPELVRGRTPPRDKSWIRIPKGTGGRFYRQLAAMKGQLARYKPYVVRLGDCDSEIAAAHGITRQRLRAINRLAGAAELRPGLTILVPARERAAAGPVADGAKTEAPGANQAESLIAAMPEGTPTAIEGKKRVFYRVTLGDSLDEVARHLGVPVEDLALWNGVLRSARLISGMILQAFVDPSADLSRVVLLDPRKVQILTAGSDAFLNEFEQRKGRRRLTYTVRQGDSLTRISKRFGLSVGSLARINKFSRRTTLKEGQKIVVYVEKGKQRRRCRKGSTAGRCTSGKKRASRAGKGSAARPSSRTEPPSTRAKPPAARAKPPATRAKPSSSRTEPSSTRAKPPAARAKPASTRAKPSSTMTKPPSTRAKGESALPVAPSIKERRKIASLPSATRVRDRAGGTSGTNVAETGTGRAKRGSSVSDQTPGGSSKAP